jgi:hypothetical protein
LSIGDEEGNIEPRRVFDEELQMVPLAVDGALRRPVPIWVVWAGADLYVRSWRACGVERDVDLVEAEARPGWRRAPPLI